MQTRQLLFALFVISATMIPFAGVAAATADSPSGAGAVHSEACAFPVSETDATGTEASVEEEPQRIVTLAPSAAQTMWEFGAEGKVVGVTKDASYLEGADQKVNITGDDGAVSVEEVVGLNPDIVLAPDVADNETVKKLRDSGVTVYQFPKAKSLDAVKSKTELIGRLTGECAAATETVSEMESTFSRVEQAVEGEDRPRVLYVFYGYTAGEGTFIDDIITTAGGTNVAAEAGISDYKPINEETVVEQNPEWIILNSGSPSVPKSQAFNSTTAVQKDQTVVVDVNLLNQPAPRTTQAVVKLAKAFHPEAYAAAEQTATATASKTATATTAERTGTEKQTPGFGVPAAIAAVAVLASALLARD